MNPKSEKLNSQKEISVCGSIRFTDNHSNSRIIEPELSAKRKKTNLVQANKVSIKISGVRNSPLNREKKMYKY